MKIRSNMERWLPIPGWEGMYEVSSLGRVHSMERLVLSGRPKVPRRVNGRILAAPIGTRGYPRVKLPILAKNGTPTGKNKEYLVHHLVLLAFVGRRPVRMEARHLDGDRTNARLTNLAYGTRSENQQDAVKHGTSTFTRGESNPSSKLTLTEVSRIRKLYATGKHNQEALATRFGVSQAMIGLITRRKKWTHC